MSGLPVMLIGAGGHARVLLEALALNGTRVLGILDADRALHGQQMGGVVVLGGDELLAAHRPGSLLLVNGIGSIGDTARRRAVFEKFKAQGHGFAGVVHPRAIISSTSKLGEGVQIMAGAVLQAGVELGDNTVVNTAAIVDHDCRAGRHVFISPGCKLGGGVELGEGTHAGLGCTVLQYLRIGSNCLLAAGCVVTKGLADGQRVRGVPAKCF